MYIHSHTYIWDPMLCYLTFRLPRLYDCCFEPYFITLGITTKKRKKTTTVKENDEERRRTHIHTYAHPERNFIKLFITFRKTKSYHVLRINDTLSFIPSFFESSSYTKSMVYTSNLYFSQLGKVGSTQNPYISWTTTFPDDTEPDQVRYHYANRINCATMLKPHSHTHTHTNTYLHWTNMRLHINGISSVFDRFMLFIG